MRLPFLLAFCINGLFTFSQTAPAGLYKEIYRPQFHFSPANVWINDPNGLVYNKGEYHLFYQSNPFANKWGHMTWSHSVSRDLVHWKHLPIAIAEENGIMIFSGSCVVDKNNTSGFATKPGQVPMVAIYTGHQETNQSQHIAYSLDNGITWKKYAGNPVLDLQKKDFRDPKVFWYGPKKYWIMSVVLPAEHLAQFYSSKDLKKWTHLSDFGPAGDIKDVWECPDLALVQVDNDPAKKKWVLQTSQNLGMQYFVGEFDGVTFTGETNTDKIVRPDYGPDYYAAVTYNNLPGASSPTAIGWVNNWAYAAALPDTPWNGAMSLPREMKVKKINNEWVLLQKPVDKLKLLRQTVSQVTNKKITDEYKMNVKSQQCEIDVLLLPASGAKAGVRVAAGNDHEAEIGYDTEKGTLYIDRSKTANQSFSAEFAKRNRFEVPLALRNNQLKLHIFFDHSIIEVFANDGEAVLTAQIFPAENDNGVSVFSTKGLTVIKELKMWSLKSIW